MIDIIIPLHNEGDLIENLFKEIEKKIGIPSNLIVIYDNEEDATIPVVKRLQNTFPFQINLEKNMYDSGTLNSIKTGFAKSTGEVVLVIRADLSDDLIIVDEMYYKAINDKCDVVCGSRYVKGGKHIGGIKRKRRFFSIAGKLLHFFIGIKTHDISNSFKMYSRRVIDTIVIESSEESEIGMELTMKAFIKGYKISELPTTWIDKSKGEVAFNIRKWTAMYMHWYRVALFHHWFSRFEKVTSD